MEFDKSKVYTALNADELKIGDEVYCADSLESLMLQVTDKTPSAFHSRGKIVRIEPMDYSNRFRIENGSRVYNLAYLINKSEEEKHLKWTDLKIGDIIKKLSESGYQISMITDIRQHLDYENSHICVGGMWISDEELAKSWSIQKLTDKL